MQTIQYSEFKKRYDVNFRAKPNDDDFIGAGGFGHVIKGYDKFNHIFVAIKVVTKLSNREGTENLKSLARHPNIAHYFGGFRIQDGKEYVEVEIYQYYNHGNLNQLIQAVKLNNEQIYNLILGILKGISHIHKGFTDYFENRIGIIHKDIKPQNILITEFKGTYTPLITDFGISELVNNEKDDHQLESSVGTILYKAPEQIKLESIRKNLDLWSFGVMFFKILTGRVPFGSNYTSDIGSSTLPNPLNTDLNIEFIHQQICESDLEEIFVQLEIYPDVFQQIIKRCLVRDNKSRVKSADELISILTNSQFSNKLNLIGKSITEKSLSAVGNRELANEESLIERSEGTVYCYNYQGKTFTNSLVLTDVELSKWHHTQIADNIKVGSIHYGKVITGNNRAEILLDYGIRGHIYDFLKIIPQIPEVGDYIAVKIVLCDFHSCNLGLSYFASYDFEMT